jgi:hypothetical protein
VRETKGERCVGEEAGSNFAMQNPTDDTAILLVRHEDIWDRKTRCGVGPEPSWRA